MQIELSASLVSLLAFALLSNIPLGYLRQGTQKYSLRWIVYIHLSIPFIVALRITNGISWQIIPFTLCLAVTGQMIGGYLHRQKHP